MALQMSYTSPEGEVYTEAYLYIPAVVFTPELATISLNWYANKSEQEAGSIPLNQTGYGVPTSDFPSGNVFDAAYIHLLTLPEFETAIKVS